MAKNFANAKMINYEEVNPGKALKQMTRGRGIDAVVLDTFVVTTNLAWKT